MQNDYALQFTDHLPPEAQTTPFPLGTYQVHKPFFNSIFFHHSSSKKTTLLTENLFIESVNFIRLQNGTEKTEPLGTHFLL